MNALTLEIMATWMLLWKEQWCLFFSQQKGTQFKCRAPLILGALLFFMNPSGCALLNNDFPEPLQGIAYSRLSFVFIFLLFQHERITFSCPIIRNLASQKSKAAFKDWLSGVRRICGYQVNNQLPNYLCATYYESWLQTTQAPFKSCILLCS